MQLLDGKKYSDELVSEYKKIVSDLDILLSIIQVGNNISSDIYIRNKIKYCESVGVKVNLYHIDNGDEKSLKKLINNLNNDPKVTGIILQSPTPGIDFNKMVELIDSSKDVDGLTKNSIYNLYINNETIIPCTVKGIIKLLEHYRISLKGANVCIIGRSNIVGKPLALALENRDATVTLCHSKTKDLHLYTKNADIVISAVGIPKLITGDYVKNGVICVDVGINRINNSLCGDFDYESVKDKALFITPVPGGVGPMTVSMIVDNLIVMKKISYI